MLSVGHIPHLSIFDARQLIGVYKETDSQSNVSYDWRSVSLLSGHAELAVDRQFSSAHLALRTGFQASGLIRDASLSMLDGPLRTFSLQSVGNKSIYGGVDLGLQLSQNASVILGGEAVYSKDKNIDTRLTAGLDVAF